MRKIRKFKILSFHQAKQHNLDQAVVLYKLFKNDFAHITTFYFSQKLVKQAGIFSKKLSRFIGKRSVAGLPAEVVFNLPLSEFKRQLAPALGYYYSPYMQAVEFQHTILKKVSPPEICLAYDGQASILFKAWKGKSKLVLDLTIGIPQYYLTIEKGADYDPALLKEADEFHNRLFNIYFDEIELADVILCGSEYVKQTVTFFRPELAAKCRILPYGVHLEDFGFADRQFTEKRKLKFVAVGTVDERKGSDTLIAAWRQFVALHPEAELHFFGAIHQKEIVEKELPPAVFLHGRVDRPVLIAALKDMDVFVLPTLHEGSSLAIFQAMAMQLPVITTFNSGTVLKHAESCEMVPIKDVNALQLALTKLYTNFEYRKMLGQNAYNLSNKHTWDDYGSKLYEILTNMTDRISNLTASE